MDNVNRTLYIPLYGKSYVSSRGILLRDEMAETIWAAEGFPLKGKAKSKWLAYYMAMRSLVFDRWTKEKLSELPDAVVLHLGCGLDSRVSRIGNGGHLWLDVDFPDVIGERKRYFAETEQYRMIASDIREPAWLENLPHDSAIVVMEGISMYLQPENLAAVLQNLKTHFEEIHLLMDCYTEFAAKASKYKNPINDVGVHRVYGLDDPESLQVLPFLQERDMTPEDLIAQLPRQDQWLFRKLYAGKFARKLYRLYEYRGRNLP